MRTIFRGELPLSALPREMLRRRLAASRRTRERADLDRINAEPPRLARKWESRAAGLLRHFRERPDMVFAAADAAKLQESLFPDDTASLVESADRIVNKSSWELAGFGILEFSRDNVWRADPLGEKDWGLSYHADVVTYEEGSADIRVLWELNRFGHAITLARAFAVTGKEVYAEVFFDQIADWIEQNPYGRGANWNCAMEVALRAINLLAAFDIFRHSEALTVDRLTSLLRLFDHHGRFIVDNSEFSYISTSNHYLSDVIGLFWIGTLLPELENADVWKRFGRAEMLREMDKQVLADGADFEASTGYHAFVAELFLLTFLIGRKNGDEFSDIYWNKLKSMLDYLTAIVRPDGGIPLIGDADGSRIVPIVNRDADDRGYLLSLAAVAFDEMHVANGHPDTPEVLWFLGKDGVDSAGPLGAATVGASSAFVEAGSYILRQDDLYLHLNASNCGLNGRGSHAHNDALSIEISALGRPFIVDPGSYAYNLDREARHLFRSTGYHSTVAINGAEQNTTEPGLPFVMGDEAAPKVILWQSDEANDSVIVQHEGYSRLGTNIVHRRKVDLNKADRYWTVDDTLTGTGSCLAAFTLHLAPALDVIINDEETLFVGDTSGRRLFIGTRSLPTPVTNQAFVSRNYGHREPSTILKWELTVDLPFTARFILVPVGPDENTEARLELIARLADNKA